MFVTKFPIFERSQVLLLRLKLLLEQKNRGWGKSNNNLLPNFSPTLSITLYFYCKLDPNANTGTFLQQKSTSDFIVYSCLLVLKFNLWNDFLLLVERSTLEILSCFSYKQFTISEMY